MDSAQISRPGFVTWAVAIVAPLAIAFRPSPVGVWLDWVAAVSAWLVVGAWLYKRYGVRAAAAIGAKP